MMQRTVKERAKQIVLLGSFNPQIFQPAWLGAKGLIRQSEADSAKIKVLHPSVADFQIGWANFQVTTDRFTVTCRDESYDEPLRDLVVGIFKSLGETPVSALGINHIVHFQVEDVETWHGIGNKIVPKEVIWNEILNKPGTRTVIVEGVHHDACPGFIRVQLEPSVVYQASIYVAVNYHVEISAEKGKPGTGLQAQSSLQSRWEDALKTSKNIVQKFQDFK